MIHNALGGRKRVKISKFKIREAENGLDRDVIGAINIGFKYLSLNGRLMTLTLTDPIRRG